jgi:hypothetical protein
MSDARTSPSPDTPKASPRRLGLILAVAAKEIRELSRDGRFRIALIAVAGLLAVALLLGRRQAHAAHAEREAAQAIADEHFREQDARTPTSPLTTARMSSSPRARSHSWTRGSSRSSACR